MSRVDERRFSQRGKFSLVILFDSHHSDQAAAFEMRVTLKEISCAKLPETEAMALPSIGRHLT